MGHSRQLSMSEQKPKSHNRHLSMSNSTYAIDTPNDHASKREKRKMKKGASFAQIDSNQQDNDMHYPFKTKKKRQKKDLSVAEDDIIIQDIDKEETAQKKKSKKKIEDMLR